MKNVFKLIGLIAVVAVIGFLSACEINIGGKDDKNGDNGGNQGNSDIDPDLYGTWKNSNSTLIITFSSDGITWGGTVGNAFSYLPSGTKWTAKNGAISHIYSGTTTKAYDYYIDSSGDLILTSISNATYTLTKDGGGYGPGNNDKVYGDFRYIEENSTITITGYTGSGGAVTIPSTIDGKPVVSIGQVAFQYKNLTSVSIPNSVITIADYAFINNHFTSVSIPNSVITIGNYAFDGSNLTSVIIPNSVTSIGSLAFCDATVGGNVSSTVTSVIIGANVNLGSGVFGYGYNDNRSFNYLYNNGGKLAGTYTRPNANQETSTWSKQ